MSRDEPMNDSDDRCITYHLDADLLKQAYFLHFRMNIFRPHTLFKMVVVWCVGVFAYAAILYAIGGRWDVLKLTLWFAPVLAAVLLLMPWLVNILLSGYSARKTFRIQKSLHPAITVSWDEAAISWVSASGTAHLPWENIHECGENARVLLIFETPRLFRMVPRHLLTPAQLGDIHAHLARLGIKLATFG